MKMRKSYTECQVKFLFSDQLSLVILSYLKNQKAEQQDQKNLMTFCSFIYVMSGIDLRCILQAADMLLHADNFIGWQGLLLT